MVRFVAANPWKAPLLLLWLTRGRAYAKARLAERVPCDPATLPYDDRVVAWLKEQRAAGRTIVLATAYDQRDAKRVATHIGVFDRVIASDGVINRKSTRKAEALRAAYRDGFVYAGNERADLKVWEAAQAAVIVNASPALLREAQARFKVERFFPR